MKYYFIYTNDHQQGPYSVQELKDLGINQGTPIWREGYDSWKKAGEIDELRVCFEMTPPPYSPNLSTPQYMPPANVKSSSFGKTLKKIGKLIMWLGLSVIILATISKIISTSQANAKSYVHEPAPVLDPEKYNPTAYLVTSGGYRKNFWGDKIVIKGTVKNIATHTNYKDVRITVYFYSKTKSVISTFNHTLYDYFPYGMTKEFELKIDFPSSMEAIDLDATSATAY